MKIIPQGKNITVLETNGGTRILFSYETAVAAFVPGEGVLRSVEKYSNTTSRHVTTWINKDHPKATQTVVEQGLIDNLVP